MKNKFYINGFSSYTGDVPLECFAPYIELRRLRRMENMAKNVLFCAYQALEQAQLSLIDSKEMGLSVAVGAGSLENTCKFMNSILDDGDELSSPTAFAGSVHNSTGLALSMFLRITGPCVTTGQFESSFPAALVNALSFLEQGMCREVLVVVADDINQVAASYAPLYPDLFTNLLRNPKGPFHRRAAAFVVANEACGKNPFELTRVEFARVSARPDNKLLHESGFAQQVVELLNKQNPFLWEDTFAGTQFILEAKPYVKP